MTNQFKLHEKSHLRLNFVRDELSRKTQDTRNIPMYFEFEAEPTCSYHLPNEYYPTDESLQYSFAEYYGFPLKSVTLETDQYGDLLLCLYGKPYATVWWEFN